MTYAYDNWIQLPTRDLYDTQVMAMAINAAKDMYDRGEQRIKDFNTTYGDFMSPFAKDMERYGQMVGNVRDTINNLYANGIDPLRSAEGRAVVSRLVNSINPAEFNMMKANAKTGYAYLDAAQKLRSQGKYSEAQELFDIVRNGGTKFQDFSTVGPNGNFNSWDRTSPIEAVTLQDLTRNHYKDRQARVLNQQDFNDPRLKGKGYNWDPKYEWSGYLRSDLLKNAPGAILSLAADPRFAFFKEEARQMVMARGETPTEAAVQRQLEENVADANTWALIDPTRKADEFALDDYRTANDIRAHSANAATDYYYKHKDDKNPGADVDEESGYSLLKDIYGTTLAQAAGIEYLPKGGIDVNELPALLNEAKKRQKAALVSGAGFSAATGQFISTDKINGVIPSIAENGRGYFLSPEAILSLRTEDAVRTSVEGWVQRGKPADSDAIKSYRNRKSNEAASALSKLNGIVDNKGKQYNVKVVSTVDRNGNNVYSMVGDDGRWHTYARVKVYLSNGENTIEKTLVEAKGKEKEIKVLKTGLELLLPIGLQSNQGKASPDFSLRQRERVGIKPFDTVKKWIGEEGNADFPWGTNLIKEETSLQK